MRLPFLQVAQETLTKARMLGRYARIAEAHAVGIAVMLDAWALEMIDGDGVVREDGPAEVLAAACGWDGDADALMAALIRARVVEMTDAGPPRLPSRARYEAALKGQVARSEKASRAASERWGRKNNAPSIAAASSEQCVADAKTQTQTQKEETASAVPLREPPAPPLVLSAPEPEKPRRAPSPTALGEFIDWARAETRPQLSPDAPDNAVMAQHQRIKLGEAVKQHGLEACKAAFRLWMGWTVAQEKGYPLGFFAAQWEQWVGQVKASGASNGPATTTPRGSPDDERAKALRAAVAAKRAAGGGA